MIDPAKRAELEQNLAMASEVYPCLWYSLYRSLIKEGFESNEALDLVKTYILANGTSTVAIPKSDFKQEKLDNEDSDPS